MRRRLDRLLRAKGCAHEAAADLVQETFVVAWRRIDEVPSDEEGARRWLFAVGSGLLANDRRADSRRRQLVDRVRAHSRGVDDRSTAPSTARLTALDGWRSLGPEEQVLLLMKGWEGLDTAGLASLLGCSTHAAEMRVCRARAHLARGFL
jgi:DNA-directed RNA polymerase specialized sigma24 family protein